MLLDPVQYPIPDVNLQPYIQHCITANFSLNDIAQSGIQVTRRTKVVSKCKVLIFEQILLRVRYKNCMESSVENMQAHEGLKGQPLN